MSPEEIAKARGVITNYWRNEIDLLSFGMSAGTGWPEALDEVERLQGIMAMASKLYQKTEAENKRLLVVAEAAKMICAQVMRAGHVYLSEEMVAKLAVYLKALDEDGK